ncbi:CapA family protein [Paenibacillus cremeus]|uniref:CapA family protein n=1 Tax=Paenibacillus cremeus TaxID=2163881 RepID=UPI0021BDCCEB|nr:CapA family protein [Paenibacillus cremeus]
MIQYLDRPSGQAPGEVAAEARGSGGGAGGTKSSPTVPPSAVSTVDAGKPADPKPPETQVKLSFVGDVMFASKVEELLQKNGYDYPFKYVKQYLEKADIAVANLETPITTRGSAQSKEYVYRSSPAALPELKKAGIDLVNLANNHSMDYGPDSLLDTLDHLDGQSLLHVGAGRTLQDAYKPVIVEQQGIKVAFLGFSRVVPEASWYAAKAKPGIAGTYDAKLPLEAIAAARAEADLVVVISHWGEERKERPNKTQTDLAHQYIDQGADLVIASHPHVLQGFEQYKGKWIAYSLGNFIFTTNENAETWDSMILEAACTKARACSLSMVPILTKWAQPIRMVEEDGRKLFERMSQLSINAKVDTEGRIEQGPLNLFATDPVKSPAEPSGVRTGTGGGTGAAGNGSGSGSTSSGSTAKPSTEPGKKSEPPKSGETPGKAVEPPKKPTSSEPAAKPSQTPKSTETAPKQQPSSVPDTKKTTE